MYIWDSIREKINRFRKKKDTTMNEKISKNFKLSELTKSETASRKHINNKPSKDHYENLKMVVDNLLQPLRDQLGTPIIVTSGYRSPKLNKEIGGSDSSQHMTGNAVDIEAVGLSTIELAKYIKDNMEFDQLILEFYNPSEGENSGWVHVSYIGSGNRNEILTALKNDSGVNYYQGLKTKH